METELRETPRTYWGDTHVCNCELLYEYSPPPGPYHPTSYPATTTQAMTMELWCTEKTDVQWIPQEDLDAASNESPTSASGGGGRMRRLGELTVRHIAGGEHLKEFVGLRHTVRSA